MHLYRHMSHVLILQNYKWLLLTANLIKVSCHVLSSWEQRHTYCKLLSKNSLLWKPVQIFKLLRFWTTTPTDICSWLPKLARWFSTALSHAKDLRLLCLESRWLLSPPLLGQDCTLFATAVRKIFILRNRVKLKGSVIKYCAFPQGWNLLSVWQVPPLV